MWQDVFAVDSRVCEARFQNMSTENKRDLKPLYLKRRLQLLQASQGYDQPIQTDAASRQLDRENNVSDKDANKNVSRQMSGTYQPIMRNKRYISLRVKLLKRQFGLPSDVLSLKSLSLSSPGPQTTPSRFRDPDLLNENLEEDVEMKIPSDKPHLRSQTLVRSSLSTDVCDSFNRVHQIFDSLHRSQVTRLMFTQMRMTMTKNVDENHKSFCIVSSSLDGKISIANLDSDTEETPNILPHPG